MSFITIVLTGGEPVPSSLRRRLPHPELVIAADSGYLQAAPLELSVDLVVGDFDSLDPATDLGRSDLERHPADKDHSDLELAIAAASARGSTELVVVGGGGGRLDHLLANAVAIASYERGPATWFTGAEVAYPIRGSRIITGSAGDLLTLLALGGDADRITTEGLRYQLDRDTIRFGSARGLSNVMTGVEVKVTVGSGTLLAIHTPAIGF